MTGTRPAWIVLDIEGTTSSTRSVRTGLYEYARPRLGPWIDAHPEDPEVRDAVARVRAEAGLAADAGTADVVVVLRRWMDGDVKATPLKTLQGQVWAAGFAGGELTAHFFPDVPPALRAWHAAGTRLAVFSSGSARAQESWFRHTGAGDLASLVDGFFDTVNAGAKREAASYRRIAEALGAPAGAVLFLSDVPAELDAAAEAGWRTTGVRRPGEPLEEAGFGRHRVVASFGELDFGEAGFREPDLGEPSFGEVR